MSIYWLERKSKTRCKKCNFKRTTRASYYYVDGNGEEKVGNLCKRCAVREIRKELNQSKALLKELEE